MISLKVLRQQMDEVLPLSSLPIGFRNCLIKIADCLEKIVEERYVCSFTGLLPRKGLAQQRLLWRLACLIRESLDDFTLDLAIRCDVEETCPQLSHLLGIWNDGASVYWMRHILPRPPQGSKRWFPRTLSTSTSRLEGCTRYRTSTGRANLQLILMMGLWANVQWPISNWGPYWITQGNIQGSFFLMLKGSTISQECRFYPTPESE